MFAAADDDGKGDNSLSILLFLDNGLPLYILLKLLKVLAVVLLVLLLLFVCVYGDRKYCCCC